MKRLILGIICLGTTLSCKSQEFTLSPVTGATMSSFAVSDDIGSFLGESSALIRPTGGLEGSLIFNEKLP